MNKRIITINGFVAISILLAGCATPPISTATEVPTSTSPPATATVTTSPTATPTETSTPTQIPPTSTATNTPLPEYTEFGEAINSIVQAIDFEVVVCGPEITEENLDRGIFLYREDKVEYFCSVEGFIEPVDPGESQYQYLLVFANYPDHGGYLFSVVGISEILFSYPSRYNVEGIEWIEGRVDPTIIRMWPLTEEQFNILLELLYPES